MRPVLTNPRLIGLLLSALSTYFVGMSILPIFPLQAAQRGASPAVVGLAFAAVMAAHMAGPLVAGVLARRVRRRTLFFAAGVVGPAAIALLGRAESLAQMVAMMMVAWFCAGINLTLIAVYTGRSVDTSTRGLAFALIALTTPLGAVLGGAVTSEVLSRLDFAAACLVLAAVWMLLPIIGLVLDEPAEVAGAVGAAPDAARTRGVEVALATLLTAQLLAKIALDIGRLGSSLVLHLQSFTATDVASVASMSGLVAIPGVLVLGGLGDRLGHGRALVASYLLLLGGLVTLAAATELWQFTLAAALLMVALCTSGALSQAVVTDLVAHSALDRTLARFSAAVTATAVMTYAAAGYSFEAFGAQWLFAAGSALSLAAAGLVAILLRRSSSPAGATSARPHGYPAARAVPKRRDSS